MSSVQKQRGMTAIGWIIVLGLIAFFTLVTLRLVPLYLEYSKVASVLESLQNEPGITRQTKADVQRLIGRRFDINDVRNLDPKIAEVESRSGRLTVTMDYERRTNMVGNIDLVVRFNKSVEVVAN
jgi:predicted Kef-type K+ transport protein